jgi:hypothetical protein
MVPDHVLANSGDIHHTFTCAEKYGGNGTAEFWKTFPANGIPATPTTQINVNELLRLVEENKDKLLVSEIKRAERCIQYLKTGGPAFQKTQLCP